MDKLDKIKEVFLSADVNAEDYQENLERIKTWEQALLVNEQIGGWRTHEVTQTLLKQLRKAYIDFGVILSQNRTISDEVRKSLWAKQDACAFIIGLIDIDTQANMESINMEIERALNDI